MASMLQHIIENRKNKKTLFSDPSRAFYSGPMSLPLLFSAAISPTLSIWRWYKRMQRGKMHYNKNK